MTETGSLLTSLDCRACCTSVAPSRPTATCPTCGHTLFATYDLAALDARRWREDLTGRGPSLWRYREVLPVLRSENVVSLGEGFSPVLPLREVAELPGTRLLLKDDGGLPTGSFKARGMSAAVSRARELGVRDLFVPSAGNAGVALAAYGTRAGLSTRVYLPERTPPAMKRACALYGATAVSLPGTLREVGEAARAAEKGRGSFDMSTLREPYRVEGKKTMGLEIFEQLAGPELPDAIIYPTGGGTGLVGMYKAFQELRTLGLEERMPRLYAVQSEGCAPVVRALRVDAARTTPWDHPNTIAPGILVPSPFASERILEAIRGSRGGGITVTDREIVEAMKHLGANEGISASPEGAAPYAALRGLVRDRAIRPGETVLLYNTGTGLPFELSELERSLGVGADSAALSDRD
jgi:threonine synthase